MSNSTVVLKIKIDCFSFKIIKEKQVNKNMLIVLIYQRREVGFQFINNKIYDILILN